MVTLIIVLAIITTLVLALTAFAGLIIGAGWNAVAHGALEPDDDPCDPDT